jgi:DNA primase
VGDMDIRELKEEILQRELISDILSELGCRHIQDRGEYYTCGNRDGDNPRAIVVYKNDYISCTNYTRQITKNGRSADIFDLIAYAEDCSFAEAMKFVCNLAGIDYYGEAQELPESLQIIKLLKSMSIGEDEEDNSPVKPISEQILSYYIPYGNKMWEDEGISLQTQQDFSIMYDPASNYIVIPIYDSVGSLVGIKGRYFGEPDEWHSRFIYLEKCNKSRILYGLWENREFIKNSNVLIIVESEKSVLKLAELGYRNVVATGGKTISKYQIELITRTSCTPILALDKDVEEDELREIASMFMDGITVYAIIDKDNILDEKDSPPDDAQKWQYLIKNNIYKIKGGDSNEQP